MLLYIYIFFLYLAIYWLFHLINFANALHDLHLQPARVRLPPWVDGVVCNGRRTLRGHLEYYTVQHPMDGGTVQLSELSVGSAGDARYPERFARIDGSNCSTVLSTLDCFQTQLPSAATAAEESKSMQENRKRGRVSAAELKRAWQQLLSALSRCLCVRLCAWICSLSHCVIYYQQTAMPVTS